MEFVPDSIAVIGLGYVGFPLAAAFAREKQVVGFDIAESRIRELKTGFDRTGEVKKSEIALISENLVLDSDPRVLKGAEFYIITVPTPVDSSNTPDLQPLLTACEVVGQYISLGSSVVFESTVYPGCTEEICVPILEKVSGLDCCPDITDHSGFFVGYSPERVNPGDQMHRLETTTKVVSGSSQSVAGKLAKLYGAICPKICIAPSIKVAEAAKAIENSQRDLNIAFVNELAVLFSRMGISVLDVLDVANTKWNFLPFAPGLVGGHCIGVDPYYLAYGAFKAGASPDLILAGRKTNNAMPDFFAHQFLKAISSNLKISISNCKIGVLGVTFKPNCPDIRNSKVFDLIRIFYQWGADVVIFDPLADPVEVLAVHDVEIEPIHDVDALFFAVPHQSFIQEDQDVIVNMFRKNRSGLIYDLHGALRDRMNSLDSIIYLSP